MTDSRINETTVPDTKHLTLVRLRAIEELYLAGYGPHEIYNLLKAQYPVTYGTYRNSIVTIRKAWGADIDAQNKLEGGHRYLASLRQLRRKALVGYKEEDKIKGRDLRLVHQLDQEIARLAGVRLKADEHTIHVDVQAARQFMEAVMAAVFEVVKSPQMREDILARVQALTAIEQ